MARRGRKARYNSCMRGYWVAEPSGQMRNSRSGWVHAWMQVDESQVPDDATVAVLGLEEEHPDDNDWSEHHWRQFHDCIGKGMYVRLAYGGPDDAEFFTKKADAEAKYGDRDAEGASSAPKDQRITTINLTQYMNVEYWKWNKRELKAVASGNAHAVGAIILKRLQKAGLKVEKAYIILHDKDTRRWWSFDFKEYVFEPKDAHVHFLAKVDGHGKKLPEFAEIIGVEREFLLYPKRGGDSFDNPLSYLIHIKDEDKYPYDPHEVVTLCGPDYLDEYSAKKFTWEQSRAKKSVSNTTRNEKDWALEEIRAGRYITLDQIRLNDDMYRVYKRHPDAVKNALAVAQSEHMWNELRAFKNNEFSMTVLFIHGGSGLGKTVLAKVVMEWLQKAHPDWQISKTPAKHATEKWHGEQIVYMDDANSIALSADAWKHLLDPYHATPIDERYHAKDEGKPRVLLISSEYAPNAFFAIAAMNAGMNVGQFIRRVGIALEVLDFGEWSSYNCRFYSPYRTDPYRVKTEHLTKVPIKDEKTHELIGYDQKSLPYYFDDVTYKMQTPQDLLIDGEVPAYTLWAAAERLVRAVEHNQKHGVDSRANADALYHDIWGMTVNRLLPTDIAVPDDYETMPPVIPVSQTPRMLRAAKASVSLPSPDEMREREERIRQRHEEQLAKAKETSEYKNAVAQYDKVQARREELTSCIEAYERMQDAGLYLSSGAEFELQRMRRERAALPIMAEPRIEDYCSYVDDMFDVICDEMNA